MRAMLVEDAGLAVLAAEGDVIAPEQRHPLRRRARDQRLAARKGDPVMLAHQPAHRRVAGNTGQTVILAARDHDIGRANIANPRRQRAARRTKRLARIVLDYHRRRTTERKAWR